MRSFDFMCLLKNNKDKMQQIEVEGTHIFFGICQVLQLEFSQSI